MGGKDGCHGDVTLIGDDNFFKVLKAAANYGGSLDVILDDAG